MKPLPSPLRPWLAAGLLALGSLALAAEPTLAYKVQPGDELIKMSEASFTTPDDWKEVAQLNRLKNPDAIRPGQILHIPLRILKRLPREATLLSASGEVLLSGQVASAGSAVAQGATLQTGSNSSAQLLLADGSRITLMPNTQAQLVTSQSMGFGAADSQPSGNWFTGLLRLTQGAVDVLAAKLVKRDVPLKIETPTSVVGVRGTEFRVAYDDPASKNARAEVLAGLVRADNPAQASGADLSKGTGAVIKPTLATITVVPLLKAPTFTPPAVNLVKPLARWAMPTLAGASSFRVQISGHQDFSSISRSLRVRSGQADLSDLPNGLWFARVRGIDADGLEGYDGVTTLNVQVPGHAGAPPLQWQPEQDWLEVVNGEHVLHLLPRGLDSSHVVLASLRPEQDASLRVAKALARVGNEPLSFKLGPLQVGLTYLLNLSVTQLDGATLTPTDYRFVALADATRAAQPLQRLESPPSASPVTPAQRQPTSRKAKKPRKQRQRP